jgi:uncharacterized protein
MINVNIGFIISTSLMDFLAITPILFGLAYYRRSISPIIVTGILFLAYTLDVTILYLPKITYFSGLRWNWQGQLLNFIWPLIIVYFLKLFTAKEVGLNLPKVKSTFILASLLAIFLVVIEVLVIYFFHLEFPPIKDLNIEGILYELTLPGLGEEIVFRGVFWAILNRYLSTTWSFLDIKCGWALIITSVLFTSWHILEIDPHTHELVFHWDGLVALPIGILLGFIREKTGSIWPCVLFHNIINGMFFLLARCIVY